MSDWTIHEDKWLLAENRADLAEEFIDNVIDMGYEYGEWFKQRHKMNVRRKNEKKV